MSSFVYTAPEGLLGELMMTARVRGVTAAARASTSGPKSSALQGTGLEELMQELWRMQTSMDMHAPLVRTRAPEILPDADADMDEDEEEYDEDDGPQFIWTKE